MSRILILGAASGIAQAYARRRAAGNDFVLAGRNETHLAAIAADLTARGAASAQVFAADLAALDGVGAAAQTIQARFGQIDEAVIAYALPGADTSDLAAVRAAIDTNFTSAALWTLALLNGATAPFTLVGITSVAGDRGRRSNAVYGSTKSAFDRLLEGLQQKYVGTTTRIIRVKPGFVDTPMTATMKKSALFATPDKVAADIERAVRKGKRVLYTPWFWWWIMMIIRHLPWFVFRRMKI